MKILKKEKKWTDETFNKFLSNREKGETEFIEVSKELSILEFDKGRSFILRFVEDIFSAIFIVSFDKSSQSYISYFIF
jgi:hypothetical protein